MEIESLQIADAKLLVTDVFRDHRGAFEGFWDSELFV